MTGHQPSSCPIKQSRYHNHSTLTIVNTDQGKNDDYTANGWIDRCSMMAHSQQTDNYTVYTLF